MKKQTEKWIAFKGTLDYWIKAYKLHETIRNFNSNSLSTQSHAFTITTDKIPWYKNFPTTPKLDSSPNTKKTRIYRLKQKFPLDYTAILVANNRWHSMNYPTTKKKPAVGINIPYIHLKCLCPMVFNTNKLPILTLHNTTHFETKENYYTTKPNKTAT